jgi:hypothetical protein
MRWCDKARAELYRAHERLAFAHLGTRSRGFKRDPGRIVAAAAATATVGTESRLCSDDFWLFLLGRMRGRVARGVFGEICRDAEVSQKDCAII